MVAPAVEAWTLPAGHAELDRLLAASTALASEAELLDAVRSAEALRCRLAALDAAVIAEVERRGLAGKHSQKTTKALLRSVLRIHPADAANRVKAALAVGPRQAMTGEPLPARFPQVAAALASGAVNPEHARTITDCIDTLPDGVRERAHDEVEALLLREAAESDPGMVRQLGQQVHTHLDPDGRLPGDRTAQRDRGLDLRVRADGSSVLHGDLTPEATERLRTLLDAITHPRTLDPDTSTTDTAAESAAGVGETAAGALDDEGIVTPPRASGPVRDTRSATQRRHDGFLQLLRLLQANAATPMGGGVHTTVVLTLPAEDWINGTGVARTGHGDLISTADAIQWAGGNPNVLGVALDSLHGILAYSERSRCFHEQQRLAMLARDGGCTFPDCDAPIAYLEADHITPWIISQRTCVDD
ncbi:MAG: DUF222 domain-containing protein, partial [Jatrophihabitans sp.]|uniref:HNH endonuclease signature motif containing protein n=1 Tax=Jatrophihabitans sp. TaxID=1932789 RepID=UPI003F7D8EC1